VDKGGAGKGSGRRWYSPEFKAEAVREVLDGPRPVSRVSVEIGVDEGTLRRWVQLERRRRAGDRHTRTARPHRTNEAQH
jgi:transposase-like protein